MSEEGILSLASIIISVLALLIIVMGGLDQ